MSDFRLRFLALATTMVLTAPLLAAPPTENAGQAKPANPPSTSKTDVPADAPADAQTDAQTDHKPPAAEPTPAAPPAPESADNPAATAADQQDPATQDEPAMALPLAEIRRYVAVFNAVREAYVEPISDAQLMRAAIRGLLFDLDPHSAYFEKDDAQAFAEQTTGSYGGLGVEVQHLENGNLLVIAPLDDSPAQRAGLRSGDVIVAVDGKPLSANNEGNTPLRGDAGTRLRLTVRRTGLQTPLQIDVVREIIQLNSVRSRLLEPGFGYVRISQFQADTANAFSDAIARLNSQNNGALRGLVIDLRSNPGGLLTSAVQIADDLLEDGLIVNTRGRIKVADATFSASPGDVLDGAPVVVIIDAGSASASEVLAGALRDNNRARIIGSRSFGKGSVQTLLALDNGDSVKLTTARYYTPNGTSIQARGIEPDIRLQPSADAPAQDAITVNEASLAGHLQNDDEATQSGDVLLGNAPIDAALRALKALLRRPAGSATPAQAASTPAR